MKVTYEVFGNAVALAVGTLLLASYLCLNATYLLPPNPLTKTFKLQVNTYMDQYFGQAWTLFAPNPGFSSTSMIVRCDSAGNTKWFDPLQPLLQRHYENRFSRSSLLLKQYKFIATSLRNEIASAQRFCEAKSDGGSCVLQERIEKSSSYGVAQSFVRHLCLGTQAQFKIVDVYPNTYAHRNDIESTSVVSFSFEVQEGGGQTEKVVIKESL